MDPFQSRQLAQAPAEPQANLDRGFWLGILSHRLMHCVSISGGMCLSSAWRVCTQLVFLAAACAAPTCARRGRHLDPRPMSSKPQGASRPGTAAAAPGELGLEKTSGQGGNKMGWSHSSPVQFWGLKVPEIYVTQV